MVFRSVMKALPVGENMRIFLGVGVIVGFASTPFIFRGARQLHSSCALRRVVESTAGSHHLCIPLPGKDAVGYDTMAEKREAMEALQNKREASGASQ
jgi:hypothetical protein